jgi:hypothetical protein
MDEHGFDFVFCTTAAEKLALVKDKLRRCEPLSKSEATWLLEQLEGKKRPAHRPKSNTALLQRKAYWRVREAIENGKLEKQAIGDLADEWGRSDKTIRRLVDAEIKSREESFEQMKRRLIRAGMWRGQ